MTKLTQQEIEKEREMFEKVAVKVLLGPAKPIDSGLFSRFSDGSYTRGWVSEIFDIWLARAELAKGGE